ncbi:hypothetical protein L208DRAFT_217021 [Tricholoma matsutake]|nr:hypothetical protein L208DRAFT_217021 [Tricholoma matsutake 945]
MLYPRHRLLQRTFSTLPNSDAVSYTRDFILWPTFLTLSEQRILLTTALRKLDSIDSTQTRRRRKVYGSSPVLSSVSTKTLHELFFPDHYYDFQEGHYDGVIRHFREMNLASWPTADDGLKPILDRLYSLCPTRNIQTHLLHLASYGEILPHVDNTSASGSWILGVSLGAERTLRMEGPFEGHHRTFDVPLPSGSAYLQRDFMRFNYKHSILKEDVSNNSITRLGQRLSIMLRLWIMLSQNTLRLHLN